MRTKPCCPTCGTVAYMRRHDAKRWRCRGCALVVENDGAPAVLGCAAHIHRPLCAQCKTSGYMRRYRSKSWVCSGCGAVIPDLDTGPRVPRSPRIKHTTPPIKFSAAMMHALRDAGLTDKQVAATVYIINRFRE